MKIEINHNFFPRSVWSSRTITPVMIIIHFVSGARDHPDDPYGRAAIRDALISGPASCHDIVWRDGSITEALEATQRAWHAGRSEFKDPEFGLLKNLNDWAIGIELAGQYNVPFEDAQYEPLAYRVKTHMDRFAIPTSRIKGHETIAGHLVRGPIHAKVDPGPSFDWLLLGQRIAEISG